MNETARSAILNSALNQLQTRFAVLPQPKSKILDKSGAPIMKSDFIEYKRLAAKKTGSMKKWRPTRAITNERSDIVERAIDLSINDPNAAGVVDTFASTVVGTGLRPHPKLSADALGLDEETISKIEDSQKREFAIWNLFADAGQRMTFNQIQFLAQRMIVQYGEFLFLVPMLKDPMRPYSLALQTINPLRLKTPVDLSRDPNIKNGIEIGSYGEPVAYWIKRSETDYSRKSDVSTNFLRISAKAGHRWRVLHGFPVIEPEQNRGLPFFAPAMKTFRDLSDFLDAELVSNIVTAAFAVWIETGAADPYGTANAMATITESGNYKSDYTQYDERYEEIESGAIMYGNTGEKPHLLAAERPGRTFEPFVKSVLKSIANSIGIPYPVLFKDFDGMNYASYRSAMLEAWRVFKNRRQWLGEKLNAPIWNMLIEESYLRNNVKMPRFYKNFYQYLQCDWIGPPKGQIEPIKEVQAEILAIKNNLKSREESLLESGRDFNSTMDQIEKEKKIMQQKDINPAADESTQPTEPAGNPTQLQFWPAHYPAESGYYNPDNPYEWISTSKQTEENPDGT
jgi:lambda family phage portal protein